LQLELLDVSNNLIKKLPKSIYTLRGSVNCANNLIEMLPNVVSTKKTKPKVERLLLKDNKIIELPERKDL
jgi:Leucine-rich repeat (LRR) protein